jgi:hypothetical protein
MTLFATTNTDAQTRGRVGDKSDKDGQGQWFREANKMLGPLRGGDYGPGSWSPWIATRSGSAGSTITRPDRLGSRRPPRAARTTRARQCPAPGKGCRRSGSICSARRRGPSSFVDEEPRRFLSTGTHWPRGPFLACASGRRAPRRGVRELRCGGVVVNHGGGRFVRLACTLAVGLASCLSKQISQSSKRKKKKCAPVELLFATSLSSLYPIRLAKLHLTLIELLAS